MPDLWYRTPTYTVGTFLDLADPGADVSAVFFGTSTSNLNCSRDRRARPQDHGPRRAPVYRRVLRSTMISAHATSRQTRRPLEQVWGRAGTLTEVTCWPMDRLHADEIDGVDIDMVLRVDGEEWARGHTRRNEVLVGSDHRDALGRDDLSRRRLCVRNHEQRLLSRALSLFKTGGDHRNGCRRDRNSAQLGCCTNEESNDCAVHQWTSEMKGSSRHSFGASGRQLGASLTAQDFPSRTVRFVVPFYGWRRQRRRRTSDGGSLVQKMEAARRGGKSAGRRHHYRHTRRDQAAPDGHTLLFTSSTSLVVTPHTTALHVRSTDGSRAGDSRGKHFTGNGDRHPLAGEFRRS